MQLKQLLKKQRRDCKAKAESLSYGFIMTYVSHAQKELITAIVDMVEGMRKGYEIDVKEHGLKELEDRMIPLDDLKAKLLESLEEEKV